tara:strand:+ start:449 stop:1603 length:1155 start_codon:yes stop_codon:yes gene_type:complete
MEDLDSIETSFVIPCLNEERTLKNVIENCHEAGKYSSSYEVIVADNGSTDNSVKIAKANNAKIVNVPIRGYGAALREGINQASGKYVVMGDSDSTYNFLDSVAMVEKLRSAKYSLVMGNRFGQIEENAMPFLHRYLGNPVLTTIGRILFGANVRDFHCGLRAFNRKDIIGLNLKSQGMEFASEMVLRSCLAGLSITEVPARLSKDHPDRKPHLRTWRDGWRHVKFMFSFSPKYLYSPLSLFFLLSSFFLLIVNLIQIEPFSGSNTLAVSGMLYLCGLWASSEYISSRLLLASEIKYRQSFVSELLFKFVKSRNFLDKSYQVIILLSTIAIVIILNLLLKSAGDESMLSLRTSQISFYISMILLSTSLYIYLVASKINTFSWLHE